MALKGNKEVVFLKIIVENSGPLRIGSDDESILIDEESNKPYLPATSICGAIKSYLDKFFEERVLNELWGSIKNESKIVVFDSYGDKKEIERRPGVKINSFSGANEKGHKFDIEYLGSGHKFELKFKAYSENEKMSENIKEMFYFIISAIDKGYLRFGAKKSSGAGIFKVKNSAICFLKLDNPIDLKKYLLDEIIYTDINLNKIDNIKENNLVEIEVVCATSGPILIQGQSQNDFSKVDSENIRNNKGQYIIPGTSIKGVLRNRCRKILSLKEEKDILLQLFGSESNVKDEDKVRSRVMFEDIIINNRKLAIQPRIKLDKFTQKVFEGALLYNETVQGEMKFKVNVEQKNDESDDKLIGLLMLALRDLCFEGLPLGSGSTIGRGRIKGSQITIRELSQEYVFNLNKEIDKRSIDYINNKISKLL